MEVISSVLNWFSSNILQNPAFFVGLLVLIGYALLKKPAHDVFSGFVKATVGICCSMWVQVVWLQPSVRS